MQRKPLNWADSTMVGQVSEIAVLSPIKRGRIPGERRTYEERLRFQIANLQGRVEQGLPTELDRVQEIHFGRMIIIRPEQFLVYSNLAGITYYRPTLGSGRQIPEPIDEYFEISADGTPVPAPPEVRSWLLTLVEFDGDLRSYFKDIAQFLGDLFDKIFTNCEDFTTTADFEAFWTWIRRYQIDASLFLPRYGDLSVVRIKELQDFKQRFDAFVAKVRSPAGRKVDRMDELFDEFLRETQQHGSGFPSSGGLYRTDEE